MNYLLIESLQRFDYYYGESMKVEFPSGSGNKMTLSQVAAELEKRLVSLFTNPKKGHLPASLRGNKALQTSDAKNLYLFHEYFDGDTGKGLGASHQTGWTALIAKRIQQLYVTAYSDRT